MSKTRISELLINDENIGDLFDMYETVNNELLSVSNDDEICKIEQKFTECQIYRKIYVWRRRGRRRRRMRSCPDDDEEQIKEKNYRLIYLGFFYQKLKL